MPASDDENKSTKSTNIDSNNDKKSAQSSTEPGKSKPPRDPFQFQGSNDVKLWAKKYRTEIAASSSSVIGTFVAFPLDFAKSRMQVHGNTFAHTIMDAYRAEGLRTFWRGVMPPMISVTLVRTVSFSIYQKTKYAVDKSITAMTGQSPLYIANAPGSYPNLYTFACFGTAGATAGALTTVISCPFELTKLNEQLAGKRESDNGEAGKKGAKGTPSSVTDVKKVVKTGSLNTARRLVRERGLRGLYVGYSLHLLRDSIGTGVYFITYESVKQLMANARGHSPTSPYAVMVAGGLCGLVSWVTIYPIDVAKSVYQNKILGGPPNNKQPLPSISFMKTGSYRGLGVSVLRSCIINMIFFSNFELIKKRINALDTDVD